MTTQHKRRIGSIVKIITFACMMRLYATNTSPIPHPDYDKKPCSPLPVKLFSADVLLNSVRRIQFTARVETTVDKIAKGDDTHKPRNGLRDIHLFFL